MAEGVREELLRLLREDDEVRAAVASIIASHNVVEELKALREDMKHGFDLFSSELKALREDFNKHEEALRRHEQELKALREDFNKLSHWMIGVAGYRWGMATEEAFRQAVDYIAKSLGYPTVERKVLLDRDGSITGAPGREIDVNVCVKDGEHFLIEVTMYAKKEDLWKLSYASKLYQRETGHKPRPLLITPYAPPEVAVLAQKLGIQVITAS